ncbi:MAG: lysine 2,3-aminomutase [Pseudomonadota bacterium]
MKPANESIPPYERLDRRDLHRIPELAQLTADERFAIEVVSAVFPFRVNRYVVDRLIDWSRAPDDPIYRLTFPHADMLAPEDFARVADLVRAGAPPERLEPVVREVQRRSNPHPAGQLALNVPTLEGRRLTGIQHKYRETVLFFPAQGQTCHAYCTYCFRWPQFVGGADLRFASREAETLIRYLEAHPEVTSVLITGGDPLVMKTEVLERYIAPLLEADLPHLASIRIGTKALAYWPYRFLGPDGDALLSLFERVVRAGKSLALMAHFSHPRELEVEPAQRALARVRRSGAVVRCQAPLVRYVNDDPLVWAELWRLEVQLGAIPYYMFVERDTGPRHYFEVPLARAFEIYRAAFQRVSGLARTVRGPSMSSTPGKVCVEGVTEIGGERVFVLKFLQARDPDWVARPFFARYDERAAWLDQLRPAFGEREFFFERGLAALVRGEALGAEKASLPRRRLTVFREVA